MYIFVGLKRFLSVCIVATIGGGCSPLEVVDVPQFTEGDITWKAWPLAVKETSGLAVYGGLYWTINDSGDSPVVYALNDEYAIEKKVHIDGAKNIDWESLAQDNDFLYIADCGNNRATRSEVQIYKVSWDLLLDVQAGGQVGSVKMDIQYSDFTDIKPSKEHNFDCEALTAVDDELWLFTKGWGNEKTKLYRLNKNTLRQSVLPEQEYDVDGLITGADFDPLSRRLVLLGYDKNLIFGQSFLWFMPVRQLPIWDEAKRIRLNPYAQWEAIAWHWQGNKQSLVLSSEKSPLLDVSFGRLKIDR